MLEDRIIVQDRGIDAGLAALMQNANKGMDPAALMAMMNNNGGFGGNGGWWWIWIILIWFCWGGNGFGGRNAGALASELNTDANTNLLMQAINGNKDAINNLSTTLNCDINAVQTALNQINDNNTANTQSIIAKLDAMQNQALLDKIDALREKNSTLISQLSNEHQTAAVGTMINQATAPIVTRLNTLQSDVDGIKCKLPNTVSVPYPQLSVYNPEIFRAAAYGAFAGDTYANYGLSSQCGC